MHIFNHRLIPLVAHSLISPDIHQISARKTWILAPTGRITGFFRLLKGAEQIDPGALAGPFTLWACKRN